jgi:SAM-dependent methyltransferase
MKQAIAGILRKLGKPMTAEIRAELAEQRELSERIATQLGSIEARLNEVQNVPKSRDEGIDALDYDPMTGGCIDPCSDGQPPLQSKLCTQSDFFRPSYPFWIQKIGEIPRFQRKMWELWYVCQALHERRMLEPGRRGIAFGVGQEPLPSLFASFGCDVLATDQGLADAERQGWAATNQHASDLAGLYKSWLCDERAFAEHVSWRALDMREIPANLENSFDFCWSTCAFEHLGSLQAGIDFVLESMNVLRPGGVAVHTTEFNLSSNKETLESEQISIYRRCDMERLVEKLLAAGHEVEPFDWRPGNGILDHYIDLPPYRSFPHLKLRIEQYTCTSVGLIARKR